MVLLSVVAIASGQTGPQKPLPTEPLEKYDDPPAPSPLWGIGVSPGNGTVSTTNGTTIDGTLAPSGTLTITGNLTFGTTTSNMRCSVSSTSVDNVQVSKAAALDGKLSVTVNSAGDFTLLHAGNGFNGSTFRSYSFTYIGCLSASVSYRNNSDGSSDAILHVVSTCD